MAVVWFIQQQLQKLLVLDFAEDVKLKGLEGL